MAQYKTGTATVTNGSAVITGIGTEFQTNAITPGHRWARSGDNVTYTIASVDSETQITLNTPYQGATGASQVYTIGKDVTVFQSYPLIFSGDIETAAFISFTFQKIDEDINRSLDGEFVAFNSPTGTLASTSVSGAIRELQDDLLMLDGEEVAFSSPTGTIAATSVSGAIRELEDTVAAGGGSLVLAGTSGGQQAYGGTDAGDDLTFNSTSNATKGFVILGSLTGLVYDEVNNRVGIGTSVPLSIFHIMTADSGGIAQGNTDELILENSGHAGMGILAGIASQAAIAFGDSGDPNIGAIVYDNNDNSLALITNNSTAIHIDSSQNVGVGETVPLGTLHVKTSDSGASGLNTGADEFVLENSGSSGMSILSGSSSNGRVVFGASGDAEIGQITYLHASNSMSFTTNTSEQMRINSSGAVGIGETVPLGKLHVKTGESSASVSTSADELILEGSGHSGITIMSGNTSIGNLYFADSGSTAIGWLDYSHNGNYMSFGAAGSEAMRIVTSGNLGINETVPDSLLHITSNSSGTLLTLESTEAGSSSGPNIVMHRNSASPADNDALSNIIWDGEDSVGNRTTYAQISGQILDVSNGTEDGKLRFYTVDGNMFREKMYLELGMTVGTATGGDQGFGTVNAIAVYDDGAGPLTGYVIQAYNEGDIDIKYWDGKTVGTLLNTPAREFKKRMEQDLSIKGYSDYWIENGHLPAYPEEKNWEEDRIPLGKLVQKHWETLEVHAVHVKTLYDDTENLKEKVKELEQEVATLKKAA